ncbi:MAG: hypothetical protein KF863_21495 [Rubrivivax sp.]|nr:hypothetical protein [Rubrivivax sp.]
MKKTHDFSGVTNPKRVIAKREAEAEGGSDKVKTAAAPAGGMSQAQFTKKAAPDPTKGKRLAEALRKRDRK